MNKFSIRLRAFGSSGRMAGQAQARPTLPRPQNYLPGLLSGLARPSGDGVARLSPEYGCLPSSARIKSSEHSWSKRMPRSLLSPYESTCSILWFGLFRSEAAMTVAASFTSYPATRAAPTMLATAELPKLPVLSSLERRSRRPKLCSSVTGVRKRWR